MVYEKVFLIITICSKTVKPADSILIYILATLSYMTLGFIAFVVMDGPGQLLGTLLVH